MKKDTVVFNGKQGVWRTVSGRKIFIAEGEDLRNAMKNSGKFKKPKGNVKELASAYHYNKYGNELKKKIKDIASNKYEDGTYDINTQKVVEFDDGYQATFQTLNDKYSNGEFGKLVDKYKKASDNQVYAGKFGGSPEISFHFKSEKDALEICKKYNQVSYWDWKNMQEVKNPYYKKGRGNDYE